MSKRKVSNLSDERKKRGPRHAVFFPSEGAPLDCIVSVCGSPADPLVENRVLIKGPPDGHVGWGLTFTQVLDLVKLLGEAARKTDKDAVERALREHTEREAHAAARDA